MHPYRSALWRLRVLLTPLAMLALLGTLLPWGAAHAARAAGGSVVAAGGLDLYGETTVPPGLSGVIQVATSPRHTVALRADGTLVAWGDNSYGQTDVPAGLRGVRQIAAGCGGTLIDLQESGVILSPGCHGYTLALGDNGRVVGWGHRPEYLPPVPEDLGDVTQVAVGGDGFGVALRSDGTVVGWGAGWPLPWADIVQVAAGGAHVVALRSDGTVVAAGDDTFGQVSVPAGLSGVVQVAAGPGASYALRDDGTVFAWGRLQPNGPTGLGGVVQIAVHGSAFAALKDDGTVVASGLGPELEAALSGAAQIAVAGDHAVAIFNSGATVLTWELGSPSPAPAVDRAGVVQLAVGESVEVALRSDGTILDTSYPAAPADLRGVTQVAAGRGHAVARKSNGTVVAWGDNASGQATVPPGLGGVVQVAAGAGHTVALRSDGTVVAWGDNASGQATVPPGLGGVKQVAAGAGHTVALRSDGTVVAWGDNAFGQATVPPGLSGVVQVAAGAGHTAALRSDGTVVVLFGFDFVHGMLAPPPELNGVVQIAAGSSHTAALRSDGSMVIWGWNPYVGPLQFVERGLTGVFQVAAAGDRTVALRSNLNLPPETTLGAPPPRNSSLVTLTFTGSDSETGVAGFECALDGAAFAACSSPWELSGLSDGSHTFMVRAVDTAGAPDLTPDTLIWVVDTTPPETAIISGPPSPSGDPFATFFISGADGDEEIHTFRCWLDGEVYEPCDSNLAIDGLANGAHTLEVAAVDSAGNVDPTPASHTWTVSASALDTAITAAPDALSGSREAQFAFAGVEAGGGLSGFLCSLDEAPPEPCASPVTYAGLADGAHLFAVQAVDGSGIADPSPATRSWTVDATAPETTITGQPASPGGSSAAFTFEGADEGSGVAGFTCRLDGAPPASCASPLQLADLADGGHTLEVWATDAAGNADPSPASYSWAVGTVETSTSFTVSHNPATAGQTVTLVATVISAAAGGGAPSGSASFSSGGAAIPGCSDIPLAGGTATCGTAFPSAGNYVLGVTYSGDEAFRPSSSPPGTLVVRLASQTTLSTSLSPAVYGQSVSLVASVSAAAPAAGTVTFLDGATALGTRALSGGQATLTTSALGGGSHMIVAVYNGSSKVGGSVSPALTQVVEAAGTATTLSASASPAVVGQRITLTALVTPDVNATSKVTGTVTFRDGEQIIGTRSLSGGEATLTTAGLGLGGHALTATYEGNASLLGSGAGLTLEVAQAATTTELALSASPAVAGQKVSFTATVRPVAPGAGAPTGSVTFLDGEAVLRTVALSGGKATMTTALQLGAHAITAVYGGVPAYAGSASAPAGLEVVQAQTATLLAASANPAVTGQRVTFTATVRPVAPGAGAPTGSVTFLEGERALGTVALSNGRAALAVTFQPGAHAITAVYGGAPAYAGSASAPAVVVVEQAATTTALTTSLNPAAAGRRVTFTATVRPAAPGAGAPTGSVTFLDGDTVLGTVALSGNRATFATVSLPRGAHAITAVYSGDGGYLSSASPVVAQIIS